MWIYRVTCFPFEPFNNQPEKGLARLGVGGVVNYFNRPPTTKELLQVLEEMETYCTDETGHKFVHQQWLKLKEVCVENVKKYGVPDLVTDGESVSATAYWEEEVAALPAGTKKDINGYTEVREFEMEMLKVVDQQEIDESEDEFFAAVRKFKEQLPESSDEEDQEEDESDHGDYI